MTDLQLGTALIIFGIAELLWAVDLWLAARKDRS